MFRQLHREGNGINSPPQKNFSGGPHGISFCELTKGDGLAVMLCVMLVMRPKDVINGMEQGIEYARASSGVALCESEKIVHV